MSETHYSAASRLIGEAQANPGPKGMFILAAAGAHGLLALADGLTALGKATVLLIEPASAPGHDENLAALADSLTRNDAPNDSSVDPAGNLAQLEEEVNQERMERHEAEQSRIEAEGEEQ